MSGKVVLISGASSGIGLAAAIVFAKNGWKTFAGVRTQSKKQDIENAAKAENVQHLVFPVDLDVTQRNSIDQAVSYVLKTAGHLDVLVNNAGYGVFGPVERLSDDDLFRQYDTNVFGAVRLIQAVLPHFRAQKSGRIINTSSVAGNISFPYWSLYSSSKSALEAISQSLHAEVAPFGIQVALVQPGYTDTPFIFDTAHRAVNEPVYDQGALDVKKQLQEGLVTGAKSTVVGATIYKAAIDAKPQFRYQPTPTEVVIVASLLKDPIGLNMGSLAGSAHG